MSNPLDAVLGNEPEADEEVVQPEIEAQAPEPEATAEAPEEPPERPRSPDGKFAPKEAATPVTPAQVEPGHVPISAMLDEREKRQALERQIADMRSRAEPPPPMSTDEALQAALYAQNLKVSRKFADRQYGAELTATVHDWAAARCDADPHFNDQMRSSDDPYEAAMQAYNRDQIVAKVTPDRLAAFEAWEAAQAGLPVSQPIPSTPRAPPPRSLVNAPGSGSLGKEAPVGNAYDALGLK